RKKVTAIYTGPIPDGMRHETMLKIGGRYRHSMTPPQLLEKLKAVDIERCRPPLQSDRPGDIEKIVEYLSQKDGPRDDDLDYVTIDTVERENVDWLWPDRFPMGRLTLVCGNPDVGKSFLSLALTAAVTRGTALPGSGKLSAPAYVLLLSTEDGYGDTVRPRLELLGADLTKII